MRRGGHYSWVCVLYVLIFLSLSFSVFAEEKVIRLNDGTVIHGEILSMEKGVYKVATKTVGLLFIKDSDVLFISTQEAGSLPFDQPLAPPEAEPPQAVPTASYPQAPILPPGAVVPDVSSQINVSDSVIDSMADLSQDEAVMDLLADPKVQDAVMRQDMDYLKNNEKFLEFMNSPKVKKLTEEIFTAPDEKEAQ